MRISYEVGKLYKGWDGTKSWKSQKDREESKNKCDVRKEGQELKIYKSWKEVSNVE